MILSLKKIIKYLCQGKIILLSGLLILLFLSLPSPTLAAWAWLTNALAAIPKAIATLALVLIILITQGIAFLMGSILDWVISPSFISLGYTQPCPALAPPTSNCNPIIGMGLNITQSFVNMILVVILVYIALSIALRLGNQRDVKQYFAKLIAVALLVNFAPVICGLIVDAANITMNYFLEPIHGGVSGVLNQVGPTISSVVHDLWAAEDISKSLGVLMLAATMIVLNISLAFAFFLFAGLFIFRYVAIWVLVILSPLAFAFWILPATKKLWDMWWNNFIQWSIIGIPIAFFLYLGIGSFTAISSAFHANLTIPEIESASALTIIDRIFPFFVVIAFLALGFIIGLATSAMGADAIIKGGKAAGKVAGVAGAGAGWGATKAAGRAVRDAPGRLRRSTSEMRALHRAGRMMGLSWREAASKTAKAQWQHRIMPAIRRTPRTAGRGVVAAGKGLWGTVKNMAIVGGATTLGVKLPKKKGLRKTGCPGCGRMGIAASARHCPSCGYGFVD